jgi:hypothetical protein
MSECEEIAEQLINRYSGTSFDAARNFVFNIMPFDTSAQVIDNVAENLHHLSKKNGLQKVTTTTFITKAQGPNKVPLYNLHQGQCFKFNNNFYMKLETPSSVRLNNVADTLGWTYRFEDNTEVEPVNIEIREV